MHTVHFSLKSRGWKDETFHTSAQGWFLTVFDAQLKMQRILLTEDVELIHVIDREYIVWAFGECQGFLLITESETYSCINTLSKALHPRLTVL